MIRKKSQNPSAFQGSSRLFPSNGQGGKIHLENLEKRFITVAVRAIR
jgi:hypothetical protein